MYEGMKTMREKKDIVKNHLLLAWEKVLATLSEVLLMPKSEIVRDAAIQRFEYNFELAWKAVKKFAEKQGIECNSPREAFKAAFRLKLIVTENVWLDMLDDRNRTSHTYNESTADEIFGNLKKYEQAMRSLLEQIKNA